MANNHNLKYNGQTSMEFEVTQCKTKTMKILSLTTVAAVISNPANNVMQERIIKRKLYI